MVNALDIRQQVILRAVVVDYVQTAEPVGSETLRKKYDLGVKSATIRNELAAMAERGYLRQPHTSAGRVPSDQGYRFYVDELMTPDELSSEEKDAANSVSSFMGTEIDDILHHACRILSRLTRYTSLATPPQLDDVRIKHIHLGRVAEDKLLVFALLNTGEVRHRILEVKGLSLKEVSIISNLIEERLSTIKVESLLNVKFTELPAELKDKEDLLKRIVETIHLEFVREDDDLYVEGTTYLVRQPEFRDLMRLELVFDALEGRKGILRVLSSALSNRRTAIVIGSESLFNSTSDCSFITARYTVGDRLSGTIGILGPTRMPYEHALPTVKSIAVSLSNLLTRMSSY